MAMSIKVQEGREMQENYVEDEAVLTSYMHDMRSRGCRPRACSHAQHGGKCSQGLDAQAEGQTQRGQSRQLQPIRHQLCTPLTGSCSISIWPSLHVIYIVLMM